MSEHTADEFERLGLEEEYQASIIHLFEDIHETFVRHGVYNNYEQRNKKSTTISVRGASLTDPETNQVEFHRDLELLFGSSALDSNHTRRCTIELKTVDELDEDGQTVGEIWFSYKPSTGEIIKFGNMMPEGEMVDWKDLLYQTNKKTDSVLSQRNKH